jgi:hypothetical protein
MIAAATRAEAPMALVTLQTIFHDAFPAYEQSHALPAHVRRVLSQSCFFESLAVCKSLNF